MFPGSGHRKAETKMIDLKDKQLKILDELKTKTCEILCKLRFQNIEPSVNAFLELKFEDDDWGIKKCETQSEAQKLETEAILNNRIDAVTSTIYERAIQDRTNSATYAKIVQQIHTKAPIRTAKVFLKQILDKCQIEFIGNFAKEEIELLEQKLADATDFQTLLINRNLKLKISSKRENIRRRKLGSICLIGEFYEAELLTPKIMLHCIYDLISFADEEHLEYLHELFIIIGQKLKICIANLNTSKFKGRSGSEWVPIASFVERLFNGTKELIEFGSSSTQLKNDLMRLRDICDSGWKHESSQKRYLTHEMLRTDACVETPRISNITLMSLERNCGAAITPTAKPEESYAELLGPPAYEDAAALQLINEKTSWGMCDNSSEEVKARSDDENSQKVESEFGVEEEVNPTKMGGSTSEVQRRGDNRKSESESRPLNLQVESLNKELKVLINEINEKDSVLHQSLAGARAVAQDALEKLSKEESANKKLRIQILDLQEQVAVLTIKNRRSHEEKTAEVEHWKAEAKRQIHELSKLKQEEISRVGLLTQAFSTYLNSAKTETEANLINTSSNIPTTNTP